MLFSTKELASYLNIQRSNLSAILNELVRENKLEKKYLGDLCFIKYIIN